MAVARPVLAKPSVAVLGIEVVEDSGDAPDAKSVAFAEALTNALRSRARLSTGPYVLAAGTDKSLIEMKLLSGCDNEAPACMAGVGSELVADRLLFGRIQKTGANYQITLKLLNVDSKALERTISDLAPIDQTSSAQVTALGKKLYAKIIGISNQGGVLIRTNVEQGEVFLDNDQRGTLKGGSVRFDGLSAGDYKVRIEADCYMTYEGTITVDGGKDRTEQIELARNALAKSCGKNVDDKRIISGGVSDEGGRGGGGYRTLFWVSATAAVVSTGGWGFAKFKMSDLAGDCIPGTPNMPVDGHPDACTDGERFSKIAYGTGGAAIVFGAASAFFFYKGYIATKERRERPLTARGQRPREILVAPTFTATTVGGVVSLEF
ncbi:MAG: PEGA domain-containing protein [Kofleriaceae bacterium]